jgi:nondiscriminating glutamyl-tRNA synthetase
MISGFDLTRANPAGAIFDAVKLKWMNAQHLRALPNLEIWNEIEPWLKKEGFEFQANDEWKEKSINLFKSYMETALDAVNLYRPLSDKDFVIKPEAEEIFTWEPTKLVLQTWKELVAVEPTEYLTEERFLKIQDLVKEKAGAKGKNLFQPIRVAIIGQPHGAELKILVPLMKKSSLLARADQVLARVK